MTDKEKLEKIHNHIKEGKEYFQAEKSSGKYTVGSEGYKECMYWAACLIELDSFIERLGEE